MAPRSHLSHRLARPVGVIVFLAILLSFVGCEGCGGCRRPSRLEPPDAHPFKQLDGVAPEYEASA
jgi:hypothetical protein